MKTYRIISALLIACLLSNLEASEQQNAPKSNPATVSYSSSAKSAATFKQPEKTYVDDLGETFLPFGPANIKLTSFQKPKPVEVLQEFKDEVAQAIEPQNPNKWRDAFINGIIKISIGGVITKICPPAGAILTAGAIADVHRRHYDPMAYLPSVEHEDYVDQYVANSLAKFTFEASAAPYRVVNSVANHIVADAIKKIDRTSFTDALVSQVYNQKKGAIKKVADKVHKKFEKASTNIKQMYQSFSEVPKEEYADSSSPLYMHSSEPAAMRRREKPADPDRGNFPGHSFEPWAITKLDRMGIKRIDHEEETPATRRLDNMGIKPVSSTHAASASSYDPTYAHASDPKFAPKTSSNKKAAQPAEQLNLNAEDQKFIAELINEHTKETTKQLSTVATLVTSLKKDNLARQEREEAEQQITDIGNYAKASGDGLALLARFMNDRESAHKLKAFGAGVQKCITSAALMSTNPVLGGIGMADSICGMIDAFEDQPEDNFREEFRESIKSIHLAIFEAVKILSEVIMKCTESTIGEVREVKQLVGEQHGNVMAEFFKIHQTQTDTQKQLHTIHENLIKGQDFVAQTAHQEHHLAAQRHEEIGGLFAELPVRHIDLEYHALDAQKKQGLYSNLLLNIITKYHSFINVLATSGSLTGSHIAQDNAQRMAEALHGSLDAASIAKHPTFSHVDLLIHMHEKFLRKTLEDDLKTGIANPLIFIKCVKQLTDLINDFCDSESCVFVSEQDKDTCTQMLKDIASELERNQQITQWLVQPAGSTTLLSEYKQATEQLKTVLDDHTKKHYETKIRAEMKDRLRSIAQAEIDLLTHTIPPLFPKLKAELTSFDQSMQTAISCFNSNAIGACYPRNAYWQGVAAVDFDYSPSLATVPNIETEAKRDDFLVLTEQIITDKKKHWGRIRTDLQQKIETNLQTNLALIDTMDINNISWRQNSIHRYPVPTGVIQTVAYPSQTDQFHLPIIMPLWKAPEQINTLVAFGKATLRATYSVSGKRLTVTGWFKHNDHEKKVYEWVSPEHTDILQTDEDIYNFIYGGRYSKPTDTITVKEHAYSLSWFEQSGGIIGTYRYPSPIEQPGIYKTATGILSLLEPAAQQLTHKTAIDTYLAEKRSEQSRAAVQMLDDQTTDLGKASNKLNVFYALLGSSLVMHDGKLQPHSTIAQSTTTPVRNSTELRTLLRDKPAQVAAALTALAALTTQPVVFTGTHKLLIKQNDYLERIRTNLTKITGIQVRVPEVPRPLAQGIPEEFMAQISARFGRLEEENRELKEQNAQVLAQNAQMLALLMALSEKK